MHYFSADPNTASRPATVRLRAAGLDLELRSDAGVFSRGAIDRGTLVLLRTVPAPPAGGELLDLGCGFGPIAVAMAVRSPGARVWAVDVNRRALELTAANAAAAGAANVVAAQPDDVPADIRFDAIYSNPPVRVGKERLHGLLQRWLARLRPGAPAYLVVQRHLGSDSLAAWLSYGGAEVSRLRSQAGYRVLEVHGPP